MNLRFSLIGILGFVSVAHGQEILIQGENNIRVTEADVRSEALKAPEAARRNYFGKAQGVSSVASNLYTRRALAAEAEREQLEKNPETAAALQIARDKVLSDARIAQIDKVAVPNTQALESYARSVYTSKAERFRAPEQVHVAHILVPKTQPDAKAAADKLLVDLRSGADFATLAREKSGDPGSAAKGGDLGLVKPRQMVPAFDQAAFALQKPGDLSPVVESPFGFHVIKLLEKKPAAMQSFDEVKEELMAEARVKLIEDARAAKSNQLLQGAKFDEAAIEAASARFR